MGIQFTGLASGLDTQSIIADLMKVENSKVETVEKEKTLMEWKKDAWDDMNTEIYSFYKEELFEFKSSSTYLKKTVTSSNESILKVNAGSSAVTGSHTIEVNKMAKGSFLTGEALDQDRNGTDITAATTAGDLIDFTALGITEATFKIRLDNDGDNDGVADDIFSEITIKEGDSIAQIVSDIDDLGLDINIGFDSKFNRIFVSSKDTGSGVQLEVDGTDEMLNALGFTETVDPDTGRDTRTGSVGQDAEFVYNETKLTSATNDITVNGMSLSLRGEGETVNVSVNQDIDAIYESVKSFVTAYNGLLMQMTDKVDAEYIGNDYMPLTSDEKAAMTDDEIELWEDKIKTSLLRNDDSLESIAYTMRSTLTMSAGVDTSSFSYNYLSDLGIVTGNYTEKGLLHIEGDEDDSTYSLKDNKLKEAIENDPEGIAEFFSSLGQELYDKMNESMKSSTLSSALTFYNDKYMDDIIEDYEDEIYDLEDSLAAVESRYYSQFTAMEQAIQQSNSTGDWLAQQLGSM